MKRNRQTIRSPDTGSNLDEIVREGQMGQKNRKAEAKNENEQALHNEALELDPGIGFWNINQLIL